MDNLLFTAIVIALLYYFLVYLPKNETKSNQRSKKTSPSSQPTFKHSSTQTEPLKAQEPSAIPETDFTKSPLRSEASLPQIQKLERDISQKERTIIGLNRSYEKLETSKNSQIANLQTQLNSLKTQLNQLAQTQKSDQKDAEKTLDQLIKELNDLNQILD
jgi:hypothetical protein